MPKRPPAGLHRLLPDPMRLLRVQGWYYLLGGVWPFVHFRSFEAVAGPKRDRFQTEVTSALFVAIGAALLTGSRARAASPAVQVLSAASAAGALVVEGRHRAALPAVFAAEAGLEAAFLAIPFITRPDRSPPSSGSPSPPGSDEPTGRPGRVRSRRCRSPG